MKIKKIMFYVSVIIFSIISSIGVSVFINSKDNNEYRLELKKGDIIEKVVINESNIPLQRISNVNTHLNLDGKIEAIDDTTIVINQPNTDEICITFGINNCDIFVNGNYIENNGDIFKYSISKKNVIKDSIGRRTITLFIVFLVIGYILIKTIQIFYKKLSDGNIKCKDIILFSISIFIIYFCTYYFMYFILDILVIVPIGIAILGVLYYIIKKKCITYEKIYIGFSVILGVTMIFAVPPLNVADESSHLYKSYNNVFGQKEDDGYIQIPSDIIDFAGRYTINVNKDENKIGGRMYVFDMFKPCEYHNMYESLIDYRNVKNLSFVPYIFSTIVMYLGVKFSICPLIILLLSRFINLAVSIICCYIAIKKVPYFKKLFLLVCLFPLFIKQSAAINMDYLTNAVSILLIAYIMYLIYNYKQNISKKDLIILAILSIVLSLCKFGYFPILLLLLLIPNSRFDSKKRAIVYKVLFIVGVFLISFLNNISLSSSEENITNCYGIKYLFTNTIDAIQIYIRTMFIEFHQDIISGFIQAFDYSQPFAFINFLVLLIYLIFILISDNNDTKINIKERIVYLIIPIMVIGIVYTIALTQWTDVGQVIIWGVQSRYFLPTAVLLYIGISSSKLKLDIDIKNKSNLYCYFISVIYILTFFNIINLFS